MSSLTTQLSDLLRRTGSTSSDESATSAASVAEQHQTLLAQPRRAHVHETVTNDRFCLIHPLRGSKSLEATLREADRTPGHHSGFSDPQIVESDLANNAHPPCIIATTASEYITITSTTELPNVVDQSLLMGVDTPSKKGVPVPLAVGWAMHASFISCERRTAAGYDVG